MRADRKQDICWSCPDSIEEAIYGCAFTYDLLNAPVLWFNLCALYTKHL